ncbi:unnamed protein product [Orchesella dallaii]|uniref:Uncharacterized protein n=1 Tax=Orchesella dallaii TaxID=48710 RepID=A0ABP1PQH2_9HEXA
MLWIVLSGLWGVHQYFNIHDTASLRGVKSQAKAFIIVTAVLRAKYLYQFTNTKRLTKLLNIFKSERFYSFFHSQKNSNWLRYIRFTSLLSIIAICCSGLNVIPTTVLMEEGWRWDYVLLAHDYSLKRFFSGWLIKEGEICEIWPGIWSSTTIPLGLLGILLGLCGMTCDTFMLDIMLCSSLELLRTTEDFTVESEPPDVDIPHGIEYIKTAFMDMITAAHQVSTLSCKMEKTLLWSYTFHAAFWCIGTAYGLHLLDKKDWAPAIVFATYTFKLLLYLLIRCHVARKCRRFSKWVVYRIVQDHEQNRGLRRRTPAAG